MKKLLAFLMLLAVSGFAQTQITVTYRYSDFANSVQQTATRSLTVTPIAYVPGSIGNTAVPIPKNQVTDTNGSATFTNLYAGVLYRAVLATPWTNYTITNGYPAGLTGTVLASTYAGVQVSQTVFAYFNLTNAVVAGTNVTVQTNGNSFTINSSGGGGSLPSGTPAQILAYNAASAGAAITMIKDGSLDTNGNLTLANTSTARGDLGLGSAATLASTAFQTNYVMVTTADPSGASDATSIVQANINTLQTAGGGILYFPCGTYKLTSTVLITHSNVTIQGAGLCTVFNPVGDYGDVFYAAPSVDPTLPGQFPGIRFDSFAISSSATNWRTSGAAIHTKWTHNAILAHVQIGVFPYNQTNAVQFYDGLKMENQAQFLVTDCQVYFHHYGLWENAHPILGAGGGIGDYYYNGLITGNSAFWGDPLDRLGTNTIGVVMAGGNTGGLQIDECGVTGVWNGVRTTGTNRELFVNNSFAADGCFGDGIYIEKGSLQNFQMTGGWAVGSLSGNGITIEAGSGSVAIPQFVIVGGNIYGNTNDGVFAGNGTGTITGVQMFENGNNDVEWGVNYEGFPQATGNFAAKFKVNASGNNFPPIISGNTGENYWDGETADVITNFAVVDAAAIRPNLATANRVAILRATDGTVTNTANTTPTELEFVHGVTSAIQTQLNAKGTGNGSVTSVTFTGDGTVLSSTPSGAVTTTGTVTATLANVSSNKYLAGPINGGVSAAPTFRLLAASDFKAAFPSTNMNALTNFDCLSAFVGYRATTNTAIAFQLTNEFEGYSGEIDLENTGATATPNVTVTASTGNNCRAANQTPGATVSYSSPAANRVLRIVFVYSHGTNKVDFMDNY